MRITDNQLHFSAIVSQVYNITPLHESVEFKKGYEVFAALLYPGCLGQYLQNTEEDMSTFIDLSKVFEFIFEELQEDLSYRPIAGDPKEFWKGYFHAQEVTERLFVLAYTPDIEVA